MRVSSPTPRRRFRPVSPSFASAACALLLAAGCGGEHRPPELSVAAEPPAPAAPRAIGFDPPQGATDVDPGRKTLAVTFDRPMDPQGWAWVIEHPSTAPEVGASSWDAGNRTNTVEVALEPGRSYVVWVNSPQYAYFHDLAGVPAEPVRWTFSTRGARAASLVPIPTHERSAPRVVALDPPQGATDVDPAKAVLRATFDRAMEASWSWVTEGSDTFPPTTGDAYFEADAKTAALPVRLEPGKTYVVWLNSGEFQLFRDLEGSPAAPLRWTFTTRAAP
jgi:RNA polymerase sigma-70 factor (ECF subfamily)